MTVNDAIAKVTRCIAAFVAQSAGSRLMNDCGGANDSMSSGSAPGQRSAHCEPAAPRPVASGLEPRPFRAAACKACAPLSNSSVTASRLSEVGRKGDQLGRPARGRAGKGGDKVGDKISINRRKSLKDINFKVPLEFHRQFKKEAAARGISMKELLEACYDAFRRAHGCPGKVFRL